MLATRVRVACSVAAATLVAIASIASIRHAGDAGASETSGVPAGRGDRCGTAAKVRSTDTIIATLHEPAEWTGVEIESDWSKTFHGVGDGPIRSWTTMRLVRVADLDHRMLDSVAPLGPITSEALPIAADKLHTVRIRVRVVVPGDLEAALAWVRANPAVAAADTEVMHAD